MRRRQLSLILAVVWIAALLGARSAMAGPGDLVVSTSHLNIQQPVEQQSPNFFFNDCPPDPECDPGQWVYNPFTSQSGLPCLWDTDDIWAKHGTGVVPKNSTVTTSVCLIGDERNVVCCPSIGFALGRHLVQVLVRAPKDTLTVSLTNDLPGGPVPPIPAIVPVDAGQDYTWTICYDEDYPGPYPEIAGSNGGHGLLINFTLSITAGSRDVRDVTAIIQVGGELAGPWSIDCEGYEV